MIGEAHIQSLQNRIKDLREQRKHAESHRLQKSIDGLIHNELSRLQQWQRFAEISASDGD